jgi:DNA-binding transcriptional LysR family regulator
VEIRHIRTFMSVAETLHFGRSAKLLHMSQPALSLQIKALEEELKVKLLDRNRQGTSLTEAGQIFRDNAAIALEQLEAATQRLNGRLRAGSVVFALGSFPRLDRRSYRILCGDFASSTLTSNFLLEISSPAIRSE